jgi:aspartate/methionine/tyrosine aminotransferase
MTSQTTTLSPGVPGGVPQGTGFPKIPDFALEVYFSKHEFTAKYHLTASDAQTITINELLALGTEADRTAFGEMGLGYTTTWGAEELRSTIASTYDHLDSSNVLVFGGAQEAMFWAMQIFVGPGDHAIVSVPNYQSMESVTIATGAEVTGFPLWSGEGSTLKWTLDVERLKTMIKPNTRVIAVNFPNNPTGFVPDHASWQALVELCEERNIFLYSDEVYRGLELDESKRISQAADAGAKGVSLNVMSKAYGMPGLRIGWIAAQDRALLQRFERAKHYTTICSSGPSEFLATIALRNAEAIAKRNRDIMRANLPALQATMERCAGIVEWTAPDGGCVMFPRYLGADGIEAFAESLVQERSAVILPASIYKSQLLEIPNDRFRLGMGRANPEAGWAELEAHLLSRKGR